MILKSLKTHQRSQKLKKLARHLKEGKSEYFLDLYNLTAPSLMKFLNWKNQGDQGKSEDILQEAYIRFLLQLDHLEIDSNFSVFGYLLKIVKNLWIDSLAKHKNTVDIDSLPLYDAKQTMAQEKAIEIRELHTALDLLSERESEIIWLRDLMGYSHKEVAKEVGISEEATRQAYVRAKKNLLSLLKEHTWEVQPNTLC